MAFLDGIQNFTPAFTGQQLALQAGSGAAQAFTSGMNAGSNRKSVNLSEKRFDAEQKQFQRMTDDLDNFARQRSFYLQGGSDSPYWSP